MSHQPKLITKRRKTSSTGLKRLAIKRQVVFASSAPPPVVPPAWLYRLTFTSRVISGVVVLLCLSIILQPVTRVTAEELSASDNAAITAPANEIEVISMEADPEVTVPPGSTTPDLDNVRLAPPDRLPVPDPESEVTQSASANLVSPETDAGAILMAVDSIHSPIAPETPNDATLTSLINDVPPDYTQTTPPQASPPEPIVALGTPTTSTSFSTSSVPLVDEAPDSESVNQLATSTTTVSGNPGPPLPGGGTDVGTSTAIESVGAGIEEEPTTETSKSSTDQLTSSGTSSLLATTTTFDVGQPGVFDPISITINQNSDVFSFNRNECTVVEDDSYYCHKTPDTLSLEDRLTAAPDEDGDLEIYLVRGGVSVQLTHNQVDDAAPYYDQYSDTIVWHRLINDRYQIMSYDIESAQESQLTSGNSNNMEPARHAGYTVWQRWIDTNWEIILFDGQREQQLTRSSEHDIAPHVRGTFVIWNSRFDDGRQQLQMYDISQRIYTVIKDSEGVTVSNPRMVVMYEAMYANGDVVTKGYDLISGEIVPLQALPRQLPDSIPPVEPTGEIRALIQPKPPESSADEGDTDGLSPVDPAPPIGDISLGTTTPETLELSLDLRPPTSTNEEFLDDSVDVAIIADSPIPDLVILPLDEIGTSTQP